MYFTNTPALNSMEAIMKKLPYGTQKAEVGFADCINTPRKTAIADFVSITEKRMDASWRSVLCWISGLDAAQLLSVMP